MSHSQKIFLQKKVKKKQINGIKKKPPPSSFISSSSTGKSTTVREALTKLPKHCEVSLLNVRHDEAELYKRAHKRTTVLDFGTGIRENMGHFKKGQFIVIEDIITLANKDEESLRQLINYKTHHDELRIICISHMLYKTKMLTLLPLFNFILFTLSPTSRGLLKVACSQGFNLEIDLTERWLKLFSDRCSKPQPAGSFAFINSAAQTLHFSSPQKNDDNDDDDDDERVGFARSSLKRPASTARSRLSISKRAAVGDNESLEKKFAECFSSHEKAATARAIFSVISKVLTSRECGSAFRSFDISFAFAQRRAAAKRKRVSVVDYVDSLLDESPAARADPLHKALHRYLKQRCKLPKMFIRNPHFVLPDDGVESSDENVSE